MLAVEDTKISGYSLQELKLYGRQVAEFYQLTADSTDGDVVRILALKKAIAKHKSWQSKKVDDRWTYQRKSLESNVAKAYGQDVDALFGPIRKKIGHWTRVEVLPLFLLAVDSSAILKTILTTAKNVSFY